MLRGPIIRSKGKRKGHASKRQDSCSQRDMLKRVCNLKCKHFVSKMTFELTCRQWKWKVGVKRTLKLHAILDLNICLLNGIQMDLNTSNHCLSGKLWYLQHNCVGDTIVYHQDSKMCVYLTHAVKGTDLFWTKWVNTTLSADGMPWLLTSPGHQQPLFRIYIHHSWKWFIIHCTVE